MRDSASNCKAGVGFLDGAYLPFSEMRLPVTDLGFQLGDLCFDTVHVHKGRFFRLSDHLARWERSIGERRYCSLGYDREQVEAVLHGCVARAKLTEAMVTFVATRGSPTTAHRDLRTCQNRFLAWAAPYYSVFSGSEADEGSDIIVAKTMRIPPEAVDPRVKNFARLDFVRALFEAYDQGANYAVLLDGEDNVTEGRGWNIFVLRGGVLMSPDRGVLEGITRETVLELALKLNIDCRLTKVPVALLRSADEVFVSSTAGGLMPVRRVDGVPIGDGAPGPVTTRMKEMYWKLHEDPRYSTPVRYASASPA